MTEHEHVHLEIESGEPQQIKNSKNQPAWILAAGLVLGALFISASVVYGFHTLVKNQLALGQQAMVAAAQVAAAPGAAQPTPAPGAPVTIADRANEPTLGSANAKVTMVEFGDFQCPFCKQYYQQNFAQIKSQYIDTGKVKLIFRDFPLTQIHVNAQIAAEAAESGQSGDALGALFQLAEHGVAEDVILPAGIVVGITAAFEFARRGDEDQFFGIVDGKGGEDNLVQQGEDGGIGADAEAQRKDHDQAEHGRLGQGSKGIADARHYDDYDVEWRRYDRRAALGRLWQAEAPAPP